MAEPEIALVFSADPWVEGLHRHCSDHGGARLRQLLVDPELALDEDYTTLVTGHRWPALTAALVDDLHRHARTVLGVWDRAEPESRALLVAVGVDGLIASDAPPSEIVEAIAALPGATDPRSVPIEGAIEAPGARRVVVGGPAGAGSTEVALALTGALGELGGRTVLVDADDVAPSLAPRLGLPLEPNICTAVSAVEHRVGHVDDAIVRVGAVDVLAGFPAPSAWTALRPAEVLRVAGALALAYDWVIFDVAAPNGSDRAAAGHGTTQKLASAIVGNADVLVGVVSPTPVGVARFIAWLAAVLPFAPDAELHIVVNRAPASAYRRGEIRSEILAVVRPKTLVFVPADRRVEDAAWAGVPVPRGGFTRAVREVAVALVASVTRDGSVTAAP